MLLNRLELTNFKNYSNQTIIPGIEMTFFYGLNGMGKTNLLDSIYYLCTTRSKFGLNEKSLILEGESFFRLSGLFNDELITAKFGEEVKKLFEKDKVPYPKLADHIGYFPVVFFAPDDTWILLGGSEERRKFLDQTLSQLDKNYLKNLLLFEKILKQRNSFLKNNAESDHYDFQLLDIYDDQLILPSEYIFQKRKEFVQDFAQEFNDISKKITSSTDSVALTYLSNLDKGSLLDQLKESRKKDIYLQRTSVGIHKDDLIFIINNFPVKKFASQGQLKSFVVALKLAQYKFMIGRHPRKPILLLDDIFDKLDAQRVKNLIEYLLDSEAGQLFITDTDEDRLKSLKVISSDKSVIYEVVQGKAILK